MVPVSTLTKHLQPVSLQPERQNTGRARVLTSADCLKMLEDKEQKKRQEAEEKERKKIEREKKKKERELVQKQKREERERRKQQKLEAAANKPSSSRRGRGRPTKKSKDPTASNSGAVSNPTAEDTDTDITQPPASKKGCGQPASTGDSDADADELTEYICDFCNGVFGEHDQDWLKCGCGQWVHEVCIEDIYQDSLGNDVFCPLCINKIYS